MLKTSHYNFDNYKIYQEKPNLFDFQEISNDKKLDNGKIEALINELTKKSPDVLHCPSKLEIMPPLQKQDPKTRSLLQKCIDLFFKIIGNIKSFFSQLFISSKTAAGEIKAASSFPIEEVSSSVVYALESKLVNPNPKHALISLAKLNNEGLLPKYKMEYANATYYFSDSFMHGGNIARIMFVELEGKVHPRVIYQSNSQGVWRVMPMLAKGYFAHIGKGMIESDTQLPLEVNLALHTLTANKIPSKEFPLAKDLVKTEIGLHQSWMEKVAVKTFIGVLTNAPKQFYKEGMIVPRPPNPKDVKLPESPGALPDFSLPLKETQIEVRHYGKLKASIFPSKDGSLRYLFYEASDGRAFIAAIEKVANNAINKFGVREECPNSNNMDAPLLEYSAQIPNGYEPGHGAPRYTSTKYLCNWNYVRELPLIQLYYSEQGRTLPDKV